MKKSGAVVLFSLVYALSSHASGVIHTFAPLLKSSQGNQIQIDYSVDYVTNSADNGVYPATQVYSAGDITIQVHGPSVKYNSRMTAVLVDNCHWNGSGANEQRTAQVQLVPFGDSTEGPVFTGRIPGPILVSMMENGSESELCEPQIALVIDNQWQHDPVSKGNNFNFSWIKR